MKSKKDKKIPVNFRFDQYLNSRLAIVAQKLGVKKTLIVEQGTAQLLRKLESENGLL